MYKLSTLNYTTIRHKSMIFFENHSFVSFLDLKHSFYDILRVGHKPGEKTANSASYKRLPML